MQVLKLIFGYFGGGVFPLHKPYGLRKGSFTTFGEEETPSENLPPAPWRSWWDPSRACGVSLDLPWCKEWVEGGQRATWTKRKKPEEWIRWSRSSPRKLPKNAWLGHTVFFEDVSPNLEILVIFQLVMLGNRGCFHGVSATHFSCYDLESWGWNRQDQSKKWLVFRMIHWVPNFIPF